MKKMAKGFKDKEIGLMRMREDLQRKSLQRSATSDLKESIRKSKDKKIKESLKQELKKYQDVFSEESGFLKLERKEQDLKRKKKKALYGRLRKGLEKAAKKKMQSKSVLKKSNLNVQVKESKAPSVLGDENRFFKGELAKEKRSMFFS